ncbi:phosphoribosylaminoimidazolesuccinocarboxamide synthase [Cuniculiplasma sp. SKW4]|uniref:phosphoribosylaminoimidazolesuccinocarboxamide synthase n=1 Tax=Cuniculiplasma sp. SKW4 TaxID=3400171 RepID=UPI003FD0AABF
MELIRTGKVKDVYDLGDRLLFKFSDRISVFDKIIPVEVPDKGASICKTSAFWFNKLNQMGINNDLIEVKSNNEMIVKKYKINESGGSKFWINYLIPLEFVVRYYVAGSLMDRIKCGKIDFHDLGFRSSPKVGDPLEEPFFEMTTKFEKTDRPLSISEAMEIGGLYRHEVLEIKETILRIDDMIQRQVSKGKLIHADGKKEFAMDNDRKITVVDTFGTADEDRFWELEDYNNGKITEISKEMVRQYYRSTGYHDRLYEARSKGLKEPDIDPLPTDLIEKTSELYRSLYTRITGEKWRY